MPEAGVAVVVDNKDDSATGRVKVRYPWHSQPTGVGVLASLPQDASVHASMVC
jgi:hypothetical protein